MKKKSISMEERRGNTTMNLNPSVRVTMEEDKDEEEEEEEEERDVQRRKSEIREMCWRKK